MKKLILLALVLIPGLASAETVYHRAYGLPTTINFCLYATDGTVLKSDAAYASGDVKLMKNEGDEANSTNGFTDEGQCYSLVLTAAEMRTKRLLVIVKDQGSAVWLDKAVIVETYGTNALAQHDIFTRRDQ